MKLFWAPQTRSPRAFWMLEEAGVNYESEIVDLGTDQPGDNGEFLEASPMGKVPALKDGDASMSESAAICIYIADRYCSGTLAPMPVHPSRGKFLYWCMYTPAVVEPAMSEKLNNVESNKARSGWGDFDTMIKTFDDALEGHDWILGDQFTAADVMLGSSAIFMRMFNMLPNSHNLDAYADRCVARPAYERAMAAVEAT
ncbi:MAG: glutathione S-transferase family protein [Gammaproteobacteria bacterium]|nr:glutathione S-transferase family protein [Gammaproteobacteria bacterium]